MLILTSFGATAAHFRSYLIGPGKVLDTTGMCVVCINTFGNGVSASPSTAPELYPDGTVITMRDNVKAQHWLLHELGLLTAQSQLALVYGYSMGGCLALTWGVEHPTKVRRIGVVCAAARCGDLNKVFLGSLRQPLLANDMEQVGRIYAGWGVGPRFYHDKLYLQLGYDSVEDFVQRSYVDGFKTDSAVDLLAQLNTWYSHDVSSGSFDGDMTEALGCIQAQVLLMPCVSDAYFTVHETGQEASMIPKCRFSPSPSSFGHRSGDPCSFPGQQADYNRLAAGVRQLMSEDASPASKL